MATCLGIRTEKIRATISLSGVEIKTPYVKSFSVDKVRGRLTTSFSATVEIPASSSFVAGSDIIIYAGEKDNEEKIFTGAIKNITTQPSFDKAGYFILTISGVDKMGDLEGRTFSRRLRSDGFSLFVSIDSGPVNRPSRGVSIDKRVRGGSHQVVSSSPRMEEGEHSKLTKMPKRGSHKHGMYGKAGYLSNWANGDGASSGIHDHTDLDRGGPAFGVFSTD
jgi:hypothetical protein